MKTIFAFRLLASVASISLWSHAAARAQETEVRDLAIARVVAPRTVWLTPQRPEMPTSVAVVVQNRGTSAEIIRGVANLAGLIGLQGVSLGSVPNLQPALLVPKDFPIVLRSQQQRTFFFKVVFDAANDGGATVPSGKHDDFRFTATLRHEALDGLPDARPGNDVWPREWQPGDPPAEGDGPAAAQRLAAGAVTDIVSASSFEQVRELQRKLRLYPSNRDLALAEMKTEVSCCGGAAEPPPEAPSSPSLRIISAAFGPCIIEKITATPEIVCIKKGAQLSDWVSFQSIRKSGQLTSWDGDRGVDDIENGDNLRTRYDSPGDKTVEGYCNGFNPAVTKTIHVVRITFQDENGGDPPSPVRLGITTAGKNFADRSKTFKVKVEPESQAANVEIKPSAGSEKRIRVFDQQTSGDTITFKVEGIGLTGSASKGDTKIEARVKNSTQASCKIEQAFSVIRPAKVGKQIQGNAKVENLAVNNRTTPADPRYRFPGAKLTTFYSWTITIPVVDQFPKGEPVGDLYGGAAVFEAFRQSGVLQTPLPINRTLQADSTYTDPVGYQAILHEGMGLAPSVPNNGLEVFLHVNNPFPVFPMPFVPKKTPLPETIFQAQVAGFPLAPEIKRTLTVTPVFDGTGKWVRSELSLTTTP